MKVILNRQNLLRIYIKSRRKVNKNIIIRELGSNYFKPWTLKNAKRKPDKYYNNLKEFSYKLKMTKGLVRKVMLSPDCHDEDILVFIN